MLKKGFKKLMSCFLSVCTAVTLLSGISVPAYAYETNSNVLFNDDFSGDKPQTGVRGYVGWPTTDENKFKVENNELLVIGDTKGFMGFGSTLDDNSKNFKTDDGVLRIKFDMKIKSYTNDDISKFLLVGDDNTAYPFMQLLSYGTILRAPATDGNWQGDFNAATEKIDTTGVNNFEILVDLKNDIIGYKITNTNGEIQFIKQDISKVPWWTENNKKKLTSIKGFCLIAGGTSEIYYDNAYAEKVPGKSLNDLMFTGVYDVPAFVDFDGFTAGKDGMAALATSDNPSNIAHKGNINISFKQSYNTGRVYIGFDITEELAKEEFSTKDKKRNFNVKVGDGNIYRIMGECYQRFGLATNTTDWQYFGGHVDYDCGRAITHRADMLLDFDKGMISGYFDGKKLSEVSMELAGGENDWSALKEKGVKGFESSSENGEDYYIDNLKVTHFDEGLTALPTVDKTNKTVDIEFGTSLTEDEITALTNKENWTVDNSITVTEAKKLTQSRIRLTVSDIANNTVYTLTVPKVIDADGNEQAISGVADKRLNCDTIKYSVSKNIKNIMLTGVDGKSMFLSDAEPGAKVITVDADFTPASITLNKGDMNVDGTNEGNTLTLNSFLEKGDYTLDVDGFVYSFTVGEGSYTVSDYGFVKVNEDNTESALTDEKAMLNGGNYKFKVSAKNTTGDNSKSLYAIVAYYGENNKMLGVEKTEVKNAEGITDGYAIQSGAVDFTVTVPEGGSVKCVKAFMWDSLNTIKPILKSVEVTN